MEIQFSRIHTSKTGTAQPRKGEDSVSGPAESFVANTERPVVGLMPQLKGKTKAEKSRQRTDKVLSAMSSPAATFAIAVGGICLSALAAAFGKD